MSKTALFTDHILIGAHASSQRTGQYLYNHLPTIVARLTSGKTFDPFFKDLSQQEIFDWIENHLIFDGNEIIGLFDHDRIIWSAPPTTPTN